ncbi:MAG: response regulator transcription factor [Rhizobiaceae bacterium]|nr:response regulator transcription factor [Rhizobiaceae bacterium]
MAERVLIVDDDTRLSAMVSDYLTGNGYVVDTAPTSGDGIARIARTPPDAVILDVMLPDVDGFETCRRIRSMSDVPVLMLTAKGEETDRIVGLELGADDYLPKPFNPRELLARLKAILRRRAGLAGVAAKVMRFGRLEIDPGSRTVVVDGHARSLTSRQFDLLVALAENAGRTLSRDRLMDLIKGEELDAFDRSIDVHISRIRAAIEDDPKNPRRIVTVRGAGYVFARFQDDGG